MIGKLWNMMMGGLVAAMLVACDEVPDVGLVADETGSLESKKTSSFLIHLESEVSGKEFTRDELLKVFDVVEDRLLEIEIAECRLAQHGDKALRVEEME
ncbi:MAG: hypothetical protein R3242_06730 [Akkermansiaceae bacterium]|nr:hypothetical protein [Akkermansiaceae bacterium]